MGALACVAAVLLCGFARGGGRAAGDSYPWHTDIVATTFWVGEIFDPAVPDGSQVASTYDSAWLDRFGGCDGVVLGGRCETERRHSTNAFFPTGMTPRQNPFYLDLPYDDVHDTEAFARRGSVVPWASEAPYAPHVTDPTRSLMKDRWVEVRRGSRTCFGQVEDAGPGVYDDAGYVFGTEDARPANREFNGAGLDVSPAMTGCLAFDDIDGQSSRVAWRFVDDGDVPAGPWRRLVTEDTRPATVR